MKRLIFQNKYAFQVTVGTASALLFLIPPLSATQIKHSELDFSQKSAPVTLSEPESILLTQMDCSGYVAYDIETSTHNIGVCQFNKNNGIYKAVSKNSNRTLVLNSRSRSKGVFVASNRGYTYTINLHRRQFTIRFPNGKRTVQRILRVSVEY
jgi:hypothetical protein